MSFEAARGLRLLHFATRSLSLKRCWVRRVETPHQPWKRRRHSRRVRPQFAFGAPVPDADRTDEIYLLTGGGLIGVRPRPDRPPSSLATFRCRSDHVSCCGSILA
jgi:hypothetical protein